MPRGAFGGAPFEPDLLQHAMTGGLTDDAWRQLVGEALASSHGVDAAEATAAWAGIGWRVDEEVLAVLGAAREAGCRVAFFSNATDRLEEDLRKCGLSDAVDVVLNSWRLGLAKPAVDAFAAAAARSTSNRHGACSSTTASRTSRARAPRGDPRRTVRRRRATP